MEERVYTILFTFRGRYLTLDELTDYFYYHKKPFMIRKFKTKAASKDEAAKRVKKIFPVQDILDIHRR